MGNIIVNETHNLCREWPFYTIRDGIGYRRLLCYFSVIQNEKEMLVTFLLVTNEETTDHIVYVIDQNAIDIYGGEIIERLKDQAINLAKKIQIYDKNHFKVAFNVHSDSTKDIAIKAIEYILPEDAHLHMHFVIKDK